MLQNHVKRLKITMFKDLSNLSTEEIREYVAQQTGVILSDDYTAEQIRLGGFTQFLHILRAHDYLQVQRRIFLHEPSLEC